MVGPAMASVAPLDAPRAPPLSLGRPPTIIAVSSSRKQCGQFIRNPTVHIIDKMDLVTGLIYYPLPTVNISEKIRTSTWSPTRQPSQNPTPLPGQPTIRPTTARPSANPTVSPTRRPTYTRTRKPSAMPSHAPTQQPTAPTPSPTRRPSHVPTQSPNFVSEIPTVTPTTAAPTDTPVPTTPEPSHLPTSEPTKHPQARRRLAEEVEEVEPEAVLVPEAVHAENIDLETSSVTPPFTSYGAGGGGGGGGGGAYGGGYGGGSYGGINFGSGPGFYFPPASYGGGSAAGGDNGATFPTGTEAFSTEELLAASSSSSVISTDSTFVPLVPQIVDNGKIFALGKVFFRPFICRLM